MSGEDTADSRQGRTRRQMLAATAGAAGLVGLAGCSDDSGGGNGNDNTDTPAEFPVPDGDTVTVGLAVPETGDFSGEGDHLAAGYDLAAANLNGGGGLVEQIDGLGGNGIDGTEVELVRADTNSSAEGATTAAENLVDLEGATVLVGGATPAEAGAIQSVATDRGVIYMGGFAPSTSLGGESCSALGFHEMYNQRQAMQALRPVLTNQYGADVNYVLLIPNTDAGDELDQALRTEMVDGAGWYRAAVERTLVGDKSFTEPIQNALAREPDAIILGYYGLDGANAVREAANLVPDDMPVIVPIMSNELAANAGDALEGIYGTAHWANNRNDDLSSAVKSAWSDHFEDSSVREDRPSSVAHLGYVQLLTYARGVASAGEFSAPAVSDALEGMSYNYGSGNETLRGCDHQSQRPVSVVQGLSAGDQFGNRFYDVVEVSSEPGYACDASPAADCSMDDP